jgi:hypothetical protein
VFDLNPSRRGRKRPGQAAVEYSLALGVLVGIFVIAAAALSSGENQYFNSLGPRFAPTPASFGTFPATPPATVILTSLPTATSFPLPTPTPTPDSNGNPTDTTLTCVPTSGDVPTSGSFQTTCTATVTEPSNGNKKLTGTIYFSDNPAGQGSFSIPSCTINIVSPATCQFTYTTTVAGTRTITAFYSGTGGGNGFQSSGASVTLTITRQPTTSISCSYQGQPAALVVGAGATCQFTVTDTSSGATVKPTGTVSWTATPGAAGGTASFAPLTCTLGGGTPGSATCQVVFKPTNITSATGFSFTVTGMYAGDGTYASSTASTSVPVGPAATSVQTFDVSLQAGQTNVNLSAFVFVNLPSTIPASSINSGTVAFTISQGNDTICTSGAVTVSGGAANTTCTVATDLAPGSYTITASYSGASNFAASTGTALLAVGLIDSTTTAHVVSAPFGASSVVFSATLVVKYPAIGQVNQGDVMFTLTDSGEEVICTTPPGMVAPNADGVTSTASATCSLPPGTPIGSYTITPSFSGGANFNPSSSPGSNVVTATLSIIRRTTTLTVVCAPSSVTAGSSTTCQATVADVDVGSQSTPTGNVLWTSNLGGSFVAPTCALTGGGTSPSCQVSYTPTDGGAYTLTANYVGDLTHLPSTGTSPLTVHRLSSTTVSCTPNPTDVGIATTCTATVTDISPVGNSGIPSGTITWTVTPASGGSFGGSGACTLSNGGVCSLGFLPAELGSLQVTAAYAGDAIYLASTGSTSLIATPRITSTSITCTPSPDNVGAPATCIVTVTDIESGNLSAPLGTVSWITDNTGSFGGAPCTLIAVNGTTTTCQVTYTPDIDGPHTLTGSYVPSDNVHSGSTGTFTFNAVLGTTTAIVCTPSPDPINAATSCRVTVTGGSASSPRPSGTVTWSTNTGSATQFSATSCLLNAAGTCTVSYTPASFGTGNTHTLTASYPGDTHYLPSSGSVLLPVTTRSTLVSISCNPSPVSINQVTICTASAFDTSPGTGTIPTGIVTWTASPAGGTLSATTCALNTNGTCFVTYTAPSTTGTITLTAAYPGDTLHDPSNATYALAVVHISNTTVTCTPSPVTVGTPVTCTVTVNDPSGSTHVAPIGTVSWSVSPNGSGSFSPTTCTMVAPVSGNPSSNSCTVTYTPTSIGTQIITANYPGDAIHAASTNTFALTVGPRLTVVASPTSTTAGNAISLTVTAVDQFGAPYTAYTGTVHFTSTDAQAVLPANYTFVAGDNATHTFNVTLKTAGNRTVTATDTVLSITTGTSNAVTVSAAPASKLLVTAAPTTVTAGNSLSVTVTAQDPFGNTAPTYTGTVQFTSTDPQGILPGNYTFVAGDNGVRTFTNSVTLKTAGSRTVTATDTVTSSITGTSGTITVNAAPATTLVFGQQPTNTVSSVSINPAVTVIVKDSFGNTVTSSSASITVAIGTNPSGGTLAGTRTVSAINGVATFSTLSIAKAAIGYTLTASSAGLAGATSSTFNVTFGPAARLAFTTQPSNTVAGTSISNPPGVQVTVQDASGNTVITSTASITLAIGTNPAAGTLSGTLTIAAVNGVATLSDLSINRTGNGYTLTATSGGLTPATSSTFNITAGAATMLGFTVQPSNAAAGASINNPPGVRVSVQDSLGNTVTTSTASITVAIATNPTGGTLSGTATASAVGGVATFANLSINRVGTGYTLTAASAGLTGATSNTFNITPGAAGVLVFSQQPSDSVAGSPISPAVTVTVQDAFGNTVTASIASITVAIGTNAGGGTLSGTTTVNAVAGVATFSTLSINRTGTGYTLTAASAGLTGATSSAFDISPGAAAKLGFTVQPSNTVAGTSMSPAVRVAVQDSLGNTVTSSSAAITTAIATNPGGGTLSGTLTVSAVNGVATFDDLSIDRTATGYGLSASSGGLTSATSALFNITSAPATQLLVEASTGSVTAGTPLSVTVTAQDTFGNTVPSYVGTLHFTATDPQANLPANYTFIAGDNGVHIFANAVTLKTAGTQTVTATDTVSAASGTTGTITVNPAAASKLTVVQQPGDALAGEVISPAVLVAVQDAFGNAITSSTASITVAIGTNPGSGTPGGTLTVSAINGVATFDDLSINKSGSGYRLSVSSSGLTSATSTTFNITPGTASQLGFVVQPITTVAGVGINPAVQVAVQDSFGNTVTGSAASIAVVIGSNPGSGTLSGTTTVSAVNGVATFSTVSLSIDKTGTGYTLSASSGGLTDATSSTFDITPAAATTLIFSQQPTDAVSTVAFNPAVTATVLDSFGNTVTGSTASITLALGTNPSSGAIGGTATVSAVNGVASFGTASVDKAGTGYTLTLASAGLTGATSTAFNISIGPAAKLAFTTQPSTAAAGTSINNPGGVVVTVQDAGGNPITGSSDSISMAFGTNPGGGPLGGSLIASASSGVATFGGLSIDKTGIGYTVVASSTGLTSATSSGFNITPGDASQLVVVAPSTATAGTAFSLSVTAQDVFGNTATGYAGTVHFTTTDSQYVLPSDYTFAPANNGVHTFSTVTLKSAGSQTVTATDTVTSAITGTSTNITVNAGTASSLVVAGYPSTIAAGSPNSFSVTALDAFGNTATGYAGTVHLSSSDPQATFAPNDASLTNGTGSFNGTLRSAGIQSITATDASTGTITGNQGGITVTALATSRLSVVASPSSVTAGTALSLTVTAQDPYGNTTPNYLGTIHFSSSDAQGVLPVDYTFVGADNGVGIFTSAATLKTAGNSTVTATDTATLTIAGTSSPINVSAAAGSSLVFVQQPTNAASSVAVSPAMTINVLDSFGNVAVGSSASITLAIAANPASGTLGGTATVAALSGLATFSTLSIDKAGADYTLAANSGGLTGTTSTAFNITVGAPARLAFTTQPSTTAAGSSISNPPGVQVTVQDAGGNTVTTSSASITMAIGTNPGSGTLSGTLTATASGGVATFGNLSINKTAVGYRLSATSAGLTPATSTTFDITPGAPSQLAFVVQPLTAVAGVGISPAFQIAVQDAFGNTVSSSAASITVAIGNNAGGGILGGTVTATASSGVATFSGLSIDKTGNGYTLTASSGGLTPATSSAFNITPAAASKLSFSQQPTNAVSTVPMNPVVTVTVQDTFGNIVTSSAALITLGIGTNPPGNGTPSGATATAVNGVATFASLSVDKAGNGYTLIAGSAGLSSATSSPFNIAVGPAVKLGFSTQPANTVAGSIISNPPGVQVSVQDAGGNTVTISSALITMAILANPGGGTLGGSLTATASGGIATFTTLSINKTGTGYTLRATSSGLTGATSGGFNIIPGVASQLVFTAQPTNTQRANPINPAGGVQVSVEDALGNVVTSSTATITIAIGNNAGSGGGGTLSGSPTAIASSGVATFNGLSIDKQGNGYTLRVTSAGLPLKNSNGFNITP